MQTAATKVQDIRPQVEVSAPESLQESLLHRVVTAMGRPHVMSADHAQAQGVFIPNWWLAILLIPLAGGVLWVIITLTNISANQISMQNTLEFRLKQVETQTKLNDEHERERQIDQARLQGEVDALTKIFGNSQKVGGN